MSVKTTPSRDRVLRTRRHGWEVTLRRSGGVPKKSGPGIGPCVCRSSRDRGVTTGLRTVNMGHREV